MLFKQDIFPQSHEIFNSHLPNHADYVKVRDLKALSGKVDLFDLDRRIEAISNLNTVDFW